MSEFINFLQTNFRTVAVLFTGIGAVISVYRYNTRHYRRGYQTGKKLTKILKERILRILTSPHSQKSMEERIKAIKDMVYQAGFSLYIEDFNKRVSNLAEQINSLKKELEVKKEEMTKDYNNKDAKIEQEVRDLESSLKIKEIELFQLKKEEDERNETLEQNSKIREQKVYFFAGLIQKIRDSLSKSTEKLETDLLRYYYAIVIALMLLGDFYITLFILKDILKIAYRDNILAIYILSVIIPLVFLVLIERFIDFLEKSPNLRKYLKRIQIFSMFVIGLILLLIYLLIIYMPFLNDMPFVLDLLRAVLFVPLVIAAAITAKKVQKEYGFSFLFTPVKVVLHLFLILLFNVLLLFEVVLSYIRKYIQRERFESRTKLTLAEDVDNIRGEIVKKNDLRLGLKQQLEAEINKLTENYQTLVTKLEEKLENLNTEMAKVRKGCEAGVVAVLKLPDQ